MKKKDHKYSNNTPLVGAIRWDAWFSGNTSPGFVDASLYTDYSYREPIYGWYDVDIPNHEDIIDQQIQHAADGMLDFWAFVWYPDNSPSESIARMNNPLKDYMRSTKHNLLQFSLILQTGWVTGNYSGGRENWRGKHVPEFVEFMQDAQYVCVDGDRPLVFWMDTADLADEKKGFGIRWTDELQHLANECAKAGLGSPYLVDMRHDHKSAALYGFDGVSDYGPASITRQGHYAFADLARHDWSKIETEHALKVIPGVSAMIDPRPRHNDEWTKGAGDSYYGYSFEIPTYSEWVSHLQGIFDWLSKHPEKTSNPPVMAIYSWNELDEGGAGIIPTKQEGTMFLDAIRAVKTGEYPSNVENRVNDSNPAIEYSGSWERAFPVQGCYCNDQTWSSTKGDYFEYKFIGNKVAVLGELGPQNGVVEVYLDGQLKETVDVSRKQVSLAQTLFEIKDLQQGSHSLKVVITGKEGIQSVGTRFVLDAITFERK